MGLIICFVWCCACLFVMIVFGDKIYNTFVKIFNEQKGLYVVLGIYLFGVIVSLSFYGFEEIQNTEQFLLETKQIAANPKGWIGDQITDIDHVSLVGTLTLVEKRLDQLKAKIRRTDDKKEIMLIGDAIGALETQSECLRQLKSPARCLK